LLVQLIIVQIITFIGLALVLRKILISSSYSETKRLQQLNEENTLKSQELARKIAEAENEHLERITKAEDETREMKKKARKEIEELRDAIVAKGKAEGERIVAQALSAKEEIRAEIEDQMQERCVAISLKMFRKILSSEEQKLVYDGLMGSALRELAAIEGDRLKAVNLDELSQKAVEVKTSHSMNPEQKEKLETVLSSKLGKKITVQEVRDREIISGIVIMLGSFMIDGSLSERFRRAAEGLK